MRKEAYIIIIILSVTVFLSIVFGENTIDTSMFGTFVESANLSSGRVNLVIDEQEFVIYDQKEWIYEGIIELKECSTEFSNYNLVLDNGEIIGYAIYNYTDNTVLLTYNDIDVLLEKISDIPMYLGYSH